MQRAVALVLAVVWCASSGAAVPAVSDPEVEKGVRAVEENELDAAIFTLDTAARRLAGRPEMAGELARAYLYLGIAFIGKTQETLARARFRDALQQQADLSVNADQFSPKVVALFESVRAELAQARGTAAAPAPAPKGGSKTPLILAGVGAAGVVGGTLVLAGGGSEASSGPSSGDGRRLVTVGPEELAIFARREVEVTPSAAGTLEAMVTWNEPAANLVVYLDEAGGTPIVTSDRSLGAGRSKQISAAVTAKAYKVGVIHCAAGCPGTPLSTTPATFTLQIKVP